MLNVGDKVIKNEATWVKNEFDSWGRGIGVGEVVQSPIPLDDGMVDIRWDKGRCFEEEIQLIKLELRDKKLWTVRIQ